MMKYIKQHKWLFLSGMITVACVLSLLNIRAPSAPGFAMININAIMSKYVKYQASSNLNAETLQKNTEIFVKQLENEIQTLSKNKNITVLVSEAVLAGAHDYTPELEKSVYQALNITRPA